jgi:hypothetical protein
MYENESALSASATGILQCLKLLAAEAASLKLLRTLSAIEEALEMAASESGMDFDGEELQQKPVKPMIH